MLQVNYGSLIEEHTNTSSLRMGPRTLLRNSDLLQDNSGSATSCERDVPAYDAAYRLMRRLAV